MGNLSIMKNLHPDTPATQAKLLIPIDATDESRWGLRHAIRRAAAGASVEVCLLYLAEPMHSWQVLRFRTEEEVRQHFAERAAIFLEDAAAQLREAGISCHGYFREAQAEQGVIDLAEELACTEIVLPSLSCFGLFPCGLSRQLRRRHCAVPLTLVTADGAAVS